MQHTDEKIEGGAARLEAFNVQVEKYNMRFHKFEVLDEVIASFFATRFSKKKRFDDIIAYDQNDIQISIIVFIIVMFSKILYRFFNFVF